jgi:hypothetical protein
MGMLRRRSTREVAPGRRRGVPFAQRRSPSPSDASARHSKREYRSNERPETVVDREKNTRSKSVPFMLAASRPSRSALRVWWFSSSWSRVLELSAHVLINEANHRKDEDTRRSTHEIGAKQARGNDQGEQRRLYIPVRHLYKPIPDDVSSVCWRVIHAQHNHLGDQHSAGNSRRDVAEAKEASGHWLRDPMEASELGPDSARGGGHPRSVLRRLRPCAALSMLAASQPIDRLTLSARRSPSTALRASSSPIRGLAEDASSSAAHGLTSIRAVQAPFRRRR